MQTEHRQKRTAYIEDIVKEYQSKPEDMADQEFLKQHKIKKYQLEIFCELVDKDLPSTDAPREVEKRSKGRGKAPSRCSQSRRQPKEKVAKAEEVCKTVDLPSRPEAGTEETLGTVEVLMEEYRNRPKGMSEQEFCSLRGIRREHLRVFRQVLSENFRTRVLEKVPKKVEANGGVLERGAKLSIRSAMCLVKRHPLDEWSYEFEDYRHQILYNMCIVPSDHSLIPAMERFLSDMRGVYEE